MDGPELASVQYMSSVSPSDDADEALRCARLL